MKLHQTRGGINPDLNISGFQRIKVRNNYDFNQVIPHDVRTDEVKSLINLTVTDNPNLVLRQITDPMLNPPVGEGSITT